MSFSPKNKGEWLFLFLFCASLLLRSFCMNLAYISQGASGRAAAFKENMAYGRTTVVKRRGYGSTRVLAPTKRRAYAYGGSARRFYKGYDRTGGFYGRYNGGRGMGDQGELKFHDVDLDDAVVAAAGTVTASINLIPQGVTESTRNGRKCTIKAIQWRYRMLLPELDAVGTPGDPDTIRVILFKDTQANGATAAVTDVLESADWQSFRNLANVQRFQILHDKVHTLNYAGIASDGAGVVSQAAVQQRFQFYKKCNIPLEFSATTGAITEIRSNNLGVLLISSNGIALLEGKFRLRFTDASY